MEVWVYCQYPVESRIIVSFGWESTLHTILTIGQQYSHFNEPIDTTPDDIMLGLYDNEYNMIAQGINEIEDNIYVYKIEWVFV